MRYVKSFGFKAKAVDEDTGIFEGLAAAYENIDLGGDVIHKGAFAETIAKDFDKIKILAQHNTNIPIGKPLYFEERDDGLFMRAQLSMTTSGKDMLILLKDGVLNEMSIGYDIVEDDEDFDGTHHLNKLKLFEVSIVTFPMNENAKITGVKSVLGKTSCKSNTKRSFKIKRKKKAKKYRLS